MDSQNGKDELKKYEEDNRTPCKYGIKCYQKNPNHHKKFKHPPKKVNDDKEVTGKKRKTPEESASSSSNTVKVQKLDAPSKEQDSSDKTEDSKVDEGTKNKETNSTEITETEETNSAEIAKKDSDDANKNDSTTEKLTSDGIETNTDEKASISETEKPDTSKEQEKENETSDVNNDSSTKANEEKMDTEEKDVEDKKTEEKPKSTDVADKKTEAEVDKVEKVTDDKLKELNTKQTDSKRLNNEENNTASPKQNSEQKTTAINKTKISKDNNFTEAKKLIEKAFLVPMPNDFYKFYEFCKDLKPVDPSTALKIAELKLVGPYDVLNGLITKEIAEKTNLLTHWRYYYDPPEFQTVIKGNDREGLHFGYWRDRPSSDPVFVATNSSNVSHKIKPVAENIFGAVAYYFEERSKKATPFEKTGFSSILGKLKNFAKNHNISLETQSVKMKSREKNVVARTIHGAGIVCPYNKKSQLGYRELSVTDNQLLKIVKKLDDAHTEEERIAAHSELGEVVRLATIAGDECDFGTCLELGHDLLSTGCFHVQNSALAVLSIAYNQLDRQAFLEIVETHLKNRKKSSSPTALDNVSKE